MNLADFIKTHLPTLKKSIESKTKLIWSGRTYSDLYPPGSKKTPVPAQAKVIGQTVDGLLKNKTSFISGEMGTGKTLMSVFSVYVLSQILKKPLRVLILTPPGVDSVWKKEIACVLPKTKVKVINSVKELQEIRKKGRNPKELEFYIITETSWKGIYNSEKDPTTFTITIPSEGSRIIKEKYFKCLNCHSLIHIKDSHQFLFLERHLQKRRYTAHASIHPKKIRKDTGSPSIKTPHGHFVIRYSLKNGGTCPLCDHVHKSYTYKKYPLSDYVKKYMKDYFQVTIVDEGSNYRNRSKIGLSLGKIKSKYKLVLSGTFMSGYADSLFNVNMQLMGGFWHKLGYTFKDRDLFQATFGFISTTVKESRLQRALASDKVLRGTRAPGVKPQIISLMRKYTAFISIDDLESDMPPKKEIYVPVEPTDNMIAEFERMRKFLKQLGINFAPRIVSYGISVWDLMFKENQWGDEKRGYLSKAVHEILPKTEKLTHIVMKEKEEGRKCLVYCTFSKKRSPAENILKVLRMHGIKALEFKDNIPPEERETLLKELSMFYDVVILNPRLVAKGVNLQEYPTIVWFQGTYDPDLLRQASRRSYRLDQTKEVRIYQMYYRDTVQESAFKLVNEKDAVSELFDGIISEKLSFAHRSTRSIVTQLAKEIIEESRRLATQTRT